MEGNRFPFRLSSAFSLTDTWGVYPPGSPIKHFGENRLYCCIGYTYNRISEFPCLRELATCDPVPSPFPYFKELDIVYWFFFNVYSMYLSTFTLAVPFLNSRAIYTCYTYNTMVPYPGRFGLDQKHQEHFDQERR